MVFSYSFPVSQVDIPQGVYLGSCFVPAGSTHANRAIQITVPVGFQFIGEDTTATEKTFTVTVNRGNCRVYRNGGTSLYATFASTRSSSVITKSFVKSATTGPFSLNCYFFNIDITYTPPILTSDFTYDFYTPFTFTITSTASLTVNTIPGCFPNVVVATSVGTSAFSSNISYASGSSDTAGYVPYALTESLTHNNIWDGSGGTGYKPSVPTTWTGLQECDVIYSNTQYVAKNLSFKNTVGSNMLQWLNTDANLGSVIGSISSSLTTNSMNFVSNLTNGFNFNGPITGPTITDIYTAIANSSNNGKTYSTTAIITTNTTYASYTNIPAFVIVDTTSNITITLPDHSVAGISGYKFTFLQKKTGNVTFVSAGGANILFAVKNSPGTYSAYNSVKTLGAYPGVSTSWHLISGIYYTTYDLHTLYE